MSTKPVTLDLEHLPDDPALLKSLVGDMAGRIETLENQLRLAIHRHYGRKSEAVSVDQMALFQKLIEDHLAHAPKPPADEAAPKVPVKGHGRRKPSKELPRKIEPYPLAENLKTCADCHAPLKKIGEERRHIVDYVPASIFIREQVAEKWACGACQDKVVTSQLPTLPIERGMAGAGLLAQVVTSKYCDHLPLYRQAEIFERQGFPVNRSTLCDFSARVADLLEPIQLAMKGEILESKVIHSDDTPVPVLDPPDRSVGPPGDDDSSADDPQGPRKARLGRLWVWVGDDEHPHTVFNYTSDRKREGPIAFLAGWKGYLQADAYAGYDELYQKRGVIEVACWAHARRKFSDAKDTDRDRGQAALAFIGRLYDVERATKERSAQERQRIRLEHSKPVLEAFKTWLDAQALITLPKSAMGEAFGYALRQWGALCSYLEDGDLDIDNNAAENGLRCVALGRKNWLFAGSDAGGRRAAIHYSLVASCKRHGIDPFAYLRDVIERVATHPQSRIRDLLPAYWRPAQVAS
jgi:transposase